MVLILIDPPLVYRKIGGGRAVVIIISIEELVNEIGYYEIIVTRNVIKQLITSRVTIISSLFENLCYGVYLDIDQHKKAFKKKRKRNSKL